MFSFKRILKVHGCPVFRKINYYEVFIVIIHKFMGVFDTFFFISIWSREDRGVQTFTFKLF